MGKRLRFLRVQVVLKLEELERKNIATHIRERTLPVVTALPPPSSPLAFVLLRVFHPSPMESKTSAAPSSSHFAAAAAGVEDALPGFSREEQAALQWALGRKEREPSKVRVCGMRLAATSLFFCWLPCFGELLMLMVLTYFVFPALPLGGAMAMGCAGKKEN